MSNNSKPIASKIMVIRHAEKPTGKYKGVTCKGKKDKYSLIVRGWERAGALVTLFDPFKGELQNNELSKPNSLYASCPKDALKFSKSKRPLKTITPLSERMDISINQTYGKDQYTAMVEEAMTQEGVVLISWQHQDIPSIANAILKNTTTAPQLWPGDRFDMVWVFNLNENKDGYTFCQVPQNVLFGDLNTIIK